MMKISYFPNIIRFHQVVIVPMVPFDSKATSKLRSALYCIVIESSFESHSLTFFYLCSAFVKLLFCSSIQLMLIVRQKIILTTYLIWNNAHKPVIDHTTIVLKTGIIFRTNLNISL